jgi:hypothetical protein
VQSKRLFFKKIRVNITDGDEAFVSECFVCCNLALPENSRSMFVVPSPEMSSRARVFLGWLLSYEKLLRAI